MSPWRHQQRSLQGQPIDLADGDDLGGRLDLQRGRRLHRHRGRLEELRFRQCPDVRRRGAVPGRDQEDHRNSDGE